MDKLTELRNRVQEVYQAGGAAPFAASFEDVVALLAHIDKLNGALDMAEEAMRDIKDHETRAACRAIKAAQQGGSYEQAG